MKDEKIIRAYDSAAPGSDTEARIWKAIEKEANAQKAGAPVSNATRRNGKDEKPVTLVARKERPFLQRIGLAAACAALVLGVAAGGYLAYLKNIQVSPESTVPGTTKERLAESTETGHEETVENTSDLFLVGLGLNPLTLDGDSFFDGDQFSDYNVVNGSGEDASKQIVTKLPNGHFKVYNYAGSEIGEFDYDSIGFFREGLAPVSDGEKWGFVNRDYQVVIPLEYDQVSIVSEGLIAVKKDDAWSYIDKQGQLVLSLRDMEGSAFRNGIAPVKNEEFKMGAINRSGQLVIPVEYDSVIVLDQYVRVKKDNLYGYLDTEGHEIIPVQYDYVEDIGEGLCCVEKDGKYGFCNTDGQIVIPLQYDCAKHFSEGRAAVCKDGAWGFIDSNGQTVIPLEYDSATFFSGGYATVEKAGAFGMIDSYGQIVVPLQYDNACYGENGLFVVEQNGKCGMISANGDVVIPLENKFIQGFSSGLVLVEKNEKWGYYDAAGRIVIPIENQHCSFPIDEHIVLVQNGEECKMLIVVTRNTVLN